MDDSTPFGYAVSVALETARMAMHMSLNRARYNGAIDAAGFAAIYDHANSCAIMYTDRPESKTLHQSFKMLADVAKEMELRAQTPE